MKKSFLVLVCLMLSGCATIVSGTQQTIFIDTPKMAGAECKLNDSKGGSWYIKETPSSVSVLKGNGPLNIVCTKQGYETETVSVEETVSGATLGNVLLGGGIGILVDAASGAAQKYPNKITVWMKPQKWSSSKEKQDWTQAKSDYEVELAKKEEAKKESQGREYN